MRLLLLSVDSGNEAHALRAAAEAWEYRVSVAWIGAKRRMLEELAVADAADALRAASRPSGCADVLRSFRPA